MPPTSRSVSERKFGQKNAFVRVWSEGMGPQSFWFGIYVLWLTSFPMSGALLAPEVRITWFALPHALALLALGRWLAPHTLQRLLPLAAIGTALVTMFYAFGAPGAWSSNAAVALWVLGLTSAPLSIQFGVLLGSARWPVAAAAIGLCLGNLGSTLLELAPGSVAGKLAALACILPGVLWPRVSQHLVLPQPDEPLSVTATPMSFWRLLLFIALFQTVSGLMYSHLWPSYREQAVWPGVELLAYVFTVLFAVRYVTRQGVGCVLMAVALAVAAFAVQHAAHGPVGHHLSLFLMLCAAGIVDLVLLSEVLVRPNRIRAYGYAVGVMVLGIALGETLVIGLKGSETSVALFALVLLNLATVALFLQRNAPQRRAVGPTAPLPLGPLAEPLTSEERTPASALPPQPAHARAPLPSHITDRLSEQELRVLEAAMEKRPYREIAQTLGITESSVKTYMQRIYRKLGIYRRGQLEGLLTVDRDSAAPASNP